MAAPPVDWRPTPEVISRANLTSFMAETGAADYPALHHWSTEHRGEFWSRVVARLGIDFAVPAADALRGSPADAEWFAASRLNIVASCFAAPPDRVAVVHRSGEAIRRTTYRELRSMVDRVANGFREAGWAAGDRIAIAMPMTVEAVAAYLGIIAAGGVVVSIADSFAPDEIAARLRLTDSSGCITQDLVRRAGKELPMYAKVTEAGAARAVVIGDALPLRGADLAWEEFLGSETPFPLRPAPPNGRTNILFSSGTTAQPKAIPWSHLTPIKAAADGHFHLDIHPDDRVAWPTNLGWMMGPWLIYAALINRAALVLYDDVPTGRGFASFVADSGVTVLGVVPSLVAAWRSAEVLHGVDWNALRLFGSTGEASNPDDMRWLMAAAGGKPVIEYCGGTEIGGAYLTGTVVQPQTAGCFSTPALGLDVTIRDEDGNPADSGELFIVPPSIGLSTELLNGDHHAVYYAATPGRDLRRHGDHMEALGGGYYRALGRADDTMNLGGIKVGSAEIERAVRGVPGVTETAAVAVSPSGGGPAQLVIFAVGAPGETVDPERWRTEMQQAIRTRLNPLFKIHQVVPLAALPRTASNKVMRRQLRARFQGPSAGDAPSVPA